MPNIGEGNSKISAQHQAERAQNNADKAKVNQESKDRKLQAESAFDSAKHLDETNSRQSEDNGTMTNFGAKIDEKIDVAKAGLNYAGESIEALFDDARASVENAVLNAKSHVVEAGRKGVNMAGNTAAAFTGGVKGIANATKTFVGGLKDAAVQGADQGIDTRQDTGKIVEKDDDKKEV